MGKGIKKFLGVLVIGLGAVITLALLAGVAIWGIAEITEWQENRWYVTQDTAKYGKIIHNGNNDIPAQFIHTFFPEKIEPYFENVEYKYQARKWCDYCCEVYLQFTISDKQIYKQFVKNATQDIVANRFPFDERYAEYIIQDDLKVSDDYYEENEGGCYLAGAKMGKILVCHEEQRIIYHAVVVTNCCGVNTNYIDFYRQYDIDPYAYMVQIGKREGYIQ